MLTSRHNRIGNPGHRATISHGLRAWVLPVSLLFGLAQCRTIPATGQNDGSTKVSPVPFIACENCEDFHIDPLGQIYTVSPRFEIRKYDQSGKFKYSYTNRELGDLHSVDVSNPMKVFLFYRDLVRIVILDNTLAEIRRIDLEQLGLQDVSAAAPSNDNQLWIFDRLSLNLLKVSQEGREILRSDPMQLLLGTLFIPDDIVQIATRVFLNDRERGLLIFDQYGQLISKPGIIPGRFFHVIGNQCYFIQNDQLMIYSMRDKMLTSQPLDIDGDTIQKLIKTDSGTYYLNSSGVFR